MQISTGLKVFMYLCAAYVVGVILYGFIIYHDDKRQLQENIDSRLKIAAKSASMLLGDNYHDTVFEDPKQAKINHNIVRSFLNEFAQYQKVKYIYTLVHKDGKLYFVSTSDSDDEKRAGTDAKFMEEYGSAPKELLGLASGKMGREVFAEYTDKWGTFRSVFILGHTAKGNVYIAGADVDQNELSILLYKSIWLAVKTSLFYLLLAIPGMYFYVKSVRKSEKEFMHWFAIDHLTGLANRFSMIKEIGSTKPYALMLLNIDSFRELNDFYGHQTGDKALVQTAQRLSGFLHDGVGDMASGVKLYKLHADEFGILFKDKVPREGLEFVAEILLQHVSSTPFLADGHEVTLNATIGISCADDGGHFSDGKYFMTASNIALREAKVHKKPYFFYDESMQIEHKYEQNIIWIKKLKTAITDDKMIPYYQPILDNATGVVDKYECLIRLIDDSDKAISPYFFLDVAKKSRLYHKITRTVIQKSFATFKDSKSSLSINISVLDIQDAQMVDFILQSLLKSGIGSRVIFEILESEGIESYEEVYSFVEKIKQYGCKVSIDDFGAGYSNFDHILKLKPDFIKIDGSLIKNIDIDPNARIITKAIVGFANELGAKTVAEFVHSKEVYDEVRSLGIDYSQGYYICEPKPTI
jgi:diguanylate cyclase (GGDEF)-like protein